ncbi:hypothetical protein HPB49_018971 [Dermacentor silvarum]|uniref:Uncharacterized protein n=1 Tax=Dermacentor silvarum TaxID=543639 RepID=A0ACB8D7K0_DERSI|nr:hypothetical protein HPB49_018971 [Dermacentor silvarum]
MPADLCNALRIFQMSHSQRQYFQCPRIHNWCVPYYAHPSRRSLPGGRFTVTIWTALDHTNSSVGSVSRLHWELQPRPLIRDSPKLVPDPFQGLFLRERYPSEQPPIYTPEETHILCSLCRIPEISGAL